MKPSLQLQIGQQLTMTPQLQQAIRLLQLSTLDLRLEIQQTVEGNPLLELEEGREEGWEDGDEPSDLADDDDEAELDLQRDDALEELIEGPATADGEWDDLYSGQSTSQSSGLGMGIAEDADAWQQSHAEPETLASHLQSQLDLTTLSDRDRIIAWAIIEALDDRGYVTLPMEDLISTAQTLLTAASDPTNAEDPLEEDEVVAVLHRLQRFDPVGVASRDLVECLAVQLTQLNTDTPYLALAHGLLSHLELLEKNDYTALRRKLAASEAELIAALGLLRTLDPAPGQQIGEQTADYVTPDVIVRAHRGDWLVELNDSALPRVGLNSRYARLARETGGGDGQYLRDRLQEARWFLKSLQSRNDTLLKVARCIVETQHDFFDHGEEAMKPLVLASVADIVGMHESTISRVTNQKFMLTPRGLFELKYFFSSHVGTESGGECSSTAIRAIMKKLVAAENPRKPLSDNKLASLLNDQGINVARRTVAKYREAMRIPSSSSRKRLV